MKTKRRKYKKRHNSSKMKLKKGTIYALSSMSMMFFSLLLLFSYTRSGSVLIQINDKLNYYFGALSISLPVILILFGLFVTGIKSFLTRPNIPVGFCVFTLSLIGLFRTGSVGYQAGAVFDSLFNPFFTVIIFILGSFVGLIVLLNISFVQIFEVFRDIFGGLAQAFLASFMSLFKQKKQDLMVGSDQPFTIKGLKETPYDKDKREVKNIKPDRRSGDEISKGINKQIVINKPFEIGIWEYPPLSLLADRIDKKADRGDIKKNASTIEGTLESFGIKAKVVEINVGPSVTQYALQIAQGTKLSKITSLSNDLALATEAPTGQIRIEAPIPGRGLVGVEVPNRTLEIVSLKTMLLSPVMQKTKSKLAVPLGLDVAGNPIIIDIARMPHVLIAGTTGSGKSVLINSIIASLLYRASPTEVKLILIDPKRVELTSYNDIPHLMVPVVVEPDESVSALKWALKEMDKRYVEFAKNSVRNIDSYNELAGFQAFPYIVILIDELADLMSLAPVEVEDSIARLAQMARATGIHLVVSTQRPSVDIITGLIKANIPSRIAFNVSSMIDSKVIIDTPGAEKLLGRGDMLYIPPDQAKPTRIQGAFVSEPDVKRIVNFLKSKNISIEYTQEILEQKVNLKRGAVGSFGETGGVKGRDEFFEQAVRIICQYDKASSSLLQRRLSIGFARAARIIDQLEAEGVVGPGDGSKPRDVLIKNPDEFLNNSLTE